MASDTANGSIYDSDSANSVITEPLGKSQLDAHARRLGEKLVVVDAAVDITSRFREDFESDVEVVEQAYKMSLEWNREREAPVPVAEWLLDNFYIIREQIRDVRKHLPKSFLRELPRIADGRIRVHEIARELTSHCDRALDEELIFRFVDEFQYAAELTVGETWAFPVMLRLVLIEHLRLLCTQLIQEYQSIDLVEEILEKWKSSIGWICQRYPACEEVRFYLLLIRPFATEVMNTKSRGRRFDRLRNRWVGTCQSCEG